MKKATADALIEFLSTLLACALLVGFVGGIWMTIHNLNVTTHPDPFFMTTKVIYTDLVMVESQRLIKPWVYLNTSDGVFLLSPTFSGSVKPNSTIKIHSTPWNVNPNHQEPDVYYNVIDSIEVLL